LRGHIQHLGEDLPTQVPGQESHSRREMLSWSRKTGGFEPQPGLQPRSCREEAAQHADVPVEGVCLYPITDYPGWVDDRCIRAGLAVANSKDRVVLSPLGQRVLGKA
jgi:hypothetical protein